MVEHWSEHDTVSYSVSSTKLPYNYDGEVPNYTYLLLLLLPIELKPVLVLPPLVFLELPP